MRRPGRGRRCAGPRRLLLRHLAEQAVERGEQPLFVAGVADEEVDVPADAVGQGLPWSDGQSIALDDRRERDRLVCDLAPAFRPPGHLGADRVTGGGQAGRGHRGEFGHRGPQPQLGGAGGGDVGGELR